MISLEPQPNQPKTSSHNPIKRDLKVSGEGCGCRRQGLEKEVVRSTASCGEWGSEISGEGWQDQQ